MWQIFQLAVAAVAGCGLIYLGKALGEPLSVGHALMAGGVVAFAATVGLNVTVEAFHHPSAGNR
jgi:hypothetical protein